METLVFATARQLATAIQQRQVSSAEVVDAYLAQIERYNPRVNAIVTLDGEGARQRACQADAALARGEYWGPLHGVPFSVKDALETAGMRTTSGFPPLADYIPNADATVVSRLRAAGGILLGKTNLPTLAGDYQTNNVLFGRTNNPWNLAHTPGGSSGGSASALAAGMMALEVGSDIAGSVRIPAHYCGVCGLKPTEHLVPLSGHIPEPPGAPRGVRHLAAPGPLARSVEDLALVLPLLAGPDERRWEVTPVRLEPPPERPLKHLHLAWSDDFGGLPVTRETHEAFLALAQQLERQGCRIERCTPAGFDFRLAWETWGELYQAEVSSSSPLSVEEIVQEAARAGITPDSPDPLLRGQARGLNATMRQYTAVLGLRDTLIMALEQFLASWDAWLVPVSVGPAMAHCPGGTPIAVDGGEIPYLLAGAGYCSPFNLTGNPAVVIPFTRSTDGLPIGLQVVGRRWTDMSLLATAAQLSEVVGPFQRPPGYETGTIDVD
jgi:amidase